MNIYYYFIYFIKFEISSYNDYSFYVTQNLKNLSTDAYVSESTLTIKLLLFNILILKFEPINPNPPVTNILVIKIKNINNLQFNYH